VLGSLGAAWSNSKLKWHYRLEHGPDVLTLRRRDGSFVAAFSARGVTGEAVLRAAEDDARGYPQYCGPGEHARAARRWVEARMGSTWEAFLRTERRLLRARRNGQLAKALNLRLPLESREELDAMASRDRRLAGHGLVELRSEGGESRYGRVEELSPEDRVDRLRAELRRLEWLMDRHKRRVGVAGTHPGHEDRQAGSEAAGE
jgi:hypothetical protein